MGSNEPSEPPLDPPQRHMGCQNSKKKNNNNKYIYSMLCNPCNNVEKVLKKPSIRFHLFLPQDTQLDYQKCFLVTPHVKCLQ